MREVDRNTRTQTFPLSMAETGRSVRIQHIFGGHGLQRRLSAMGLAPGMEMEVLRNDRGGPLVIKVLDSRFMIGRGMANHIQVG
jgi:Fe2+ transport system protein FeoA